MTLYLSVTPHIEPTHTQWDREGGTRLPYRYGASTRAERVASGAPRESAEVLLQRHLRASAVLARSAHEHAEAQEAAAVRLRSALDVGDAARTRTVVDEMGAAFRDLYHRLQDAERAWNDLAPAVGGE
jgi:hypothetical protein